MLLLLNAGKGKEFKGKSLEEVEVSEDLLVLEEHKNDAEIDKEIKIQEQISDNPETGPKLNSKPECITKKRSRGRWSNIQKDLILKYFKSHINKKIVPRKEECVEFLQKHYDLFNPCTWVRIKTLVYNTYRNAQ